MSLQIFAEVDDQETAASETALCIEHLTEANKQQVNSWAYQDVIRGSWRDCSGNEVLRCNVCGRDGEGLLEPVEV